MFSKKTIDIVIPIYNEQECLPELLARLETIRRDLRSYEMRFIMINDGSSDKSLPMMMDYASTHAYLKVINFSRNFGHQFATTAGLDHAEGDYVLIIDADLQDPPELLVDMLKKSEEGYDVVYGKRNKREGESALKLLTAKWFYRLLNFLCSLDIPADTGDFRLITRRVVLAFRAMPEQHRFIRGMIPWVGFKSAPFYYHREKRYAGTTKYPIKKMFKFALDAIFSFSNVPLRLATYSGLFLVLLGGLVALFMVYLKLFTTFTVPGISAVIISIIIMGGFQIIMLGIIGEYVGKIFEQSKHRPLYVVSDIKN